MNSCFVKKCSILILFTWFLPMVCLSNKIKILGLCIACRAFYTSYYYIQHKNDVPHYGKVYLSTKNTYLQLFDDVVKDACKWIDKKIMHKKYS